MKPTDEGYQSFSYVIEAEGKKIVYSGDIASMEELDNLIADLDDPQYRGTGRGDPNGGSASVNGFPAGLVGEQFGGGGHLKNVVEADFQQAAQDDIGIVQMMELTEQSGLRESDVIFESLQQIKGVVD
jgi:hypothetical protein